MKKRMIGSMMPAVALVLAVVLTLASCAASSGGAANDYAPNYGPPVDNDYTADGMEGGNSAGGGNIPTDGDYERKIIRTVTMRCETKAYDDAVSLIMSTLAAHGGYVEASNSTGTGYEDVKGSERHATYTLRVPAEQLDAFLETLRTDEGIRILSQNASSNEITGTYYDTVSRLETLEAEKAALTKMLEGFEDYTDMHSMLTVQDRLYDVIEEMEVLKTKLSLYDGQVAMSTVNLTLDEVIEYTKVEIPDPTFGERLSKAFVESWTDFWEGCQDFAVLFVEMFPTLMVLAFIFGTPVLVALIVVLSVVKAKKKKKQKKHDAA